MGVGSGPHPAGPRSEQGRPGFGRGAVRARGRAVTSLQSSFIIEALYMCIYIHIQTCICID